MRRLFLFAICLLPVILFGFANDALAKGNDGGNNDQNGHRLVFMTKLKGANEVPARPTSDLKGSARITIDLTKNVLCWDLDYRTRTQHVTAAHIHKAPAGVAAGVVFGFFNPPTAIKPFPNDGCRAGAHALLADIVAHPSQYYVNVHTTENSGGAGRGQLQAKKHEKHQGDS